MVLSDKNEGVGKKLVGLKKMENLIYIILCSTKLSTAARQKSWKYHPSGVLFVLFNKLQDTTEMSQRQRDDQKNSYLDASASCPSKALRATEFVPITSLPTRAVDSDATIVKYVDIVQLFL